MPLLSPTCSLPKQQANAKGGSIEQQRLTKGFYEPTVSHEFDYEGFHDNDDHLQYANNYRVKLLPNKGKIEDEDEVQQRVC